VHGEADRNARRCDWSAGHSYVRPLLQRSVPQENLYGRSAVAHGDAGGALRTHLDRVVGQIPGSWPRGPIEHPDPRDPLGTVALSAGDEPHHRGTGAAQPLNPNNPTVAAGQLGGNGSLPPSTPNPANNPTVAAGTLGGTQSHAVRSRHDHESEHRKDSSAVRCWDCRDAEGLSAAAYRRGATSTLRRVLVAGADAFNQPRTRNRLGVRDLRQFLRVGSPHWTISATGSSVIRPKIAHSYTSGEPRKESNSSRQFRPVLMARSFWR
jgi:hypothetical protein